LLQRISVPQTVFLETQKPSGSAKTKATDNCHAAQLQAYRLSSIRQMNSG
jgi:hypothetical protein